MVINDHFAGHIMQLKIDILLESLGIFFVGLSLIVAQHSSSQSILEDYFVSLFGDSFSSFSLPCMKI